MSGAPKLEIKGLKTWQGRDGYGYQGDLYVNGRKALHFLDEGNGGAVWVDYFDASGQRSRRQPETGPGAEFLAYVAALPADAEGRKPSIDIVLAGLADEHELSRRLVRACKSKTLFRVPGDAPAAYREIKKPFTPELRAQVVARHPEAVFINETVGNGGGMAALGLTLSQGRER